MPDAGPCGLEAFFHGSTPIHGAQHGTEVKHGAVRLTPQRRGFKGCRLLALALVVVDQRVGCRLALTRLLRRFLDHQRDEGGERVGSGLDDQLRGKRAVALQKGNDLV